MNRSLITACFCLVPFFAGCALSEEETATDPSQPEEVDAEGLVSTTRSGILGSDSCKNTDITVTNSRTRNGVNTAIDVKKVEYYSASEGGWYTEDLTDFSMNFGTSHTWWDEDLAYAENDLITSWRVHYRVLEGGSWSSVVYQQIDTPNQTCLADANFSMTVE